MEIRFSCKPGSGRANHGKVMTEDGLISEVISLDRGKTWQKKGNPPRPATGAEKKVALATHIIRQGGSVHNHIVVDNMQLVLSADVSEVEVFDMGDRRELTETEITGALLAIAAI